MDRNNRSAYRKWYKTCKRQNPPKSMGDSPQMGHRMLNWVYGQRFRGNYWRTVKKENRRIIRQRLKMDLYNMKARRIAELSLF